MLRAGLALRVDGHRGSGTRRHLYAMLLTAEIISDIPVAGTGLAGYVFTTLHVPGLRLLSPADAIDVGAHRGPRDCTTGSGDIVAASATDLVTENAADNRTDYRPWNAAGMVGVFLGDNTLMGGTNKVKAAAGVGLPIPNATVEVDGQVVVRDGKLVSSEVAASQ